MAGPLHGYRILDLTTVISGPFATMLLADQGADVIKVEGVNRPDYARGAGHGENKFTATFLNNNRNKRAVAIDLKSSEGRELLLKIAATCDVFIQNFRPGVVDRLGIGEQAVRAVAPAIIYVSISGFGEKGPWAHKPVYDPMYKGTDAPLFITLDDTDVMCEEKDKDCNGVRKLNKQLYDLTASHPGAPPRAMALRDTQHVAVVGHHRGHIIRRGGGPDSG